MGTRLEPRCDGIREAPKVTAIPRGNLVHERTNGQAERTNFDVPHGLRLALLGGP